MTANLQHAPLAERLDHLVRLIGSQRFLQKQGLGNEVPFFICPFSPAVAVEMEKLQKQLANQLSQQGVRVLQINLYDLVHDILSREGDWQWCVENESAQSKKDLLGQLQGILDAERVIVPEIAQRMSRAEFDVLLLNGVGEVFPYLQQLHEALLREIDDGKRIQI